MRFTLAGLLLLFIPAFAIAQPSGEVESIGFNGSYRANCWTPMVVRLKPDSTDPAEYEIAVYQHDLDGDRPIYTRPITLNGSAQSSSQRFPVYFLPTPIEKGLPDSNPNAGNSGSMHDLQRDLQVFLCKPGSPPKAIVELPLTSTVTCVDPYRDNYAASKPRSSKLILAVSEKSAKPTLDPNNYHDAFGVMEDVTVVSIRPEQLPDDPIGYDAVDGIIWLDGDPSKLGTNTHALDALKDYVRFGGQLVISQTPENWQENQQFTDLMPVDVTSIATKSNFEPLMSLAAPHTNLDYPLRTAANSWSRAQGPFQMARASAHTGTVVDKWIDWKQDGSYTDTTPYIARKAYGLGQVTWVAQELSTELAPFNATSWPYVWDTIFGWKNNSYVVAPGDSLKHPGLETRMKIYQPAGPSDLGYPLTKGLDLSSRANWLILLAILFFVVYWLVSGPGSYLYLAMKKRQGMSWFFFSIAALVATLVTVLVVKLVLRGPPEIRHVSFVRIAPGQPALVHSRFGLYIPRDGDQKIALADTSRLDVSYLAPFAIHPQQLGSDVTEFPSPTDYYVPVRDLQSDTPPELTVAYRSSSKKFQAQWVGDWQNRFVGSVKLNPDDSRMPISGVLTNGTGVDLTDVYLAFNGPNDTDQMIYVPDWPAGTTYDIAKDFANPDFVGKDNTREALPGQGKIICAEIASDTIGWAKLLHDHFRRGGGDDPNIGDTDMRYIIPMLSVLDRMPAIDNPKNYNGNNQLQIGEDRTEIYSRGARMLNASASIGAGQLVIMAASKGLVPIPIPLSVDDDKMKGEGTVFYQFILPIDRGKLAPPTTQPVKK